MSINNPISRFSLPDLVEIQRASFCWFLEEGLAEEIKSFSPITDYTGNLELYLLGDKYKLKCKKNPHILVKIIYIEYKITKMWGVKILINKSFLQFPLIHLTFFHVQFA